MALKTLIDLIDGFLHDRFVSSLVISVLAVKVIIWLVALASGTSGGVLAPLLIFGGAIGWLMGLWLPGGEAGFWALLGMAAMMGGTMRAPLTATFFAVEVTGDFHPLVAVFVASVTAYCVTVLLLKRSMLTEKIDQPFRIAVGCSKRCRVDNDIVFGRVECAIGFIGEFCIGNDAPRLQDNVAQF